MEKLGTHSCCGASRLFAALPTIRGCAVLSYQTRPIWSALIYHLTSSSSHSVLQPLIRVSAHLGLTCSMNLFSLLHRVSSRQNPKHTTYGLSAVVLLFFPSPRILYLCTSPSAAEFEWCLSCFYIKFGSLDDEDENSTFFS